MTVVPGRVAGLIEQSLILLIFMVASPVIASDTANNATIVIPSSTMCSICLNGAAITLPDKAVQIPGFEGIADNCQSLSTLASTFLLAESEDCGLIQSIGTLCGCPKEPDSCELCQGDGPARYAQRQLEFLAPSFDGIVPTCEMIEAGLHSYPNDDAYCGGSQMFLADYCGCGATDDVPPFVPDEKRCIICADYPHRIIRNKTIEIENFPFETCGQLTDAAWALFENFWADSRNVNDYFNNNCFLMATLSIYCGCPSESQVPPEDQCQICKADNTHITPFPDRQVDSDTLDFPGLVVGGSLKPTCSVLAGMARFFNSKATNALWQGHSAMCNLFQSIGEESCGCTPTKPLCQACTKPMPDDFLNRTMSNRAPFDTLTCGQIVEIAGRIDGGSINFGSSDDWLEFDCNMIQYGGFVCGCNDQVSYWGTETQAQQRTAVWLQRASAFLSVIGSVAIVLDVLRKQHWRKFKSQIMLGLSFFDLVSSIAWGIGPMATDKGFAELNFGIDPTVAFGREEIKFYGSIGNEASCLAQGFIIHWGFTSILFNMCLAYFYKLSIVNKMREHNFRWKLRLALLATPVLIGTTVAVLSLQFIIATPVGCTFGSFNTGDGGWAKVIGLFYVPYGPAFVYIPFTTWYIYRRVRSQSGSTNPSQQAATTLSLANSEGTSTNYSETRVPRWRGFFDAITTRHDESSVDAKVFWEAFWYVIAFFASYTIFLVVFAVDGLKDGVLIMASILTPLQGFFNSINYFRHPLAKMCRKGFENLASTRKRAFRLLPSIANRNSIPSAMQAMQGDHGLSDLPSISEVQSSGFVWSRPFASGRSRQLSRPFESGLRNNSKAIEEEKEEDLPSSTEGYESGNHTVEASSGTVSVQPTSAISAVSTMSTSGLEAGESDCQTIQSSSGTDHVQQNFAIDAEVSMLSTSGLETGESASQTAESLAGTAIAQLHDAVPLDKVSKT